MLRTTDAGTVLPGRCFLCERAFEEGESAWNTGMIYEPDEFGGRLFGNKMVCDQCTQVLAEAAGYVSQTNHVDAITAVTGYNLEQQNEIEVLREKVLHAESQGVNADELAAKVAALLKPRQRGDINAALVKSSEGADEGPQARKPRPSVQTKA